MTDPIIAEIRSTRERLAMLGEMKMLTAQHDQLKMLMENNPTVAHHHQRAQDAPLKTPSSAGIARLRP
jgi:hypothetical protein